MEKIKVLVFKDNRYGYFEIYDAQNGDNLLRVCDDEKELKSVCEAENYEIV